MIKTQEAIAFKPDGTQGNLRSKQDALGRPFQYAGLPLIVTAVLAATSQNPNSLVQIVLSFFLLVMPWIAYREWQNSGKFGLPIYAIIAALHWLSFAVALYWGDRLSPVWYSYDAVLSEDAITKTLLMVVLGVGALGLGMRSRAARIIRPRTRSQLVLNSAKLDYVRWLLVAGLFASYIPSVVYTFGESGRQWIIAFQTTVPLLAALILLRRYFQGTAKGIDKALIAIYILGRLMIGLGSGWSGSVFYLGASIGFVYLLERRRIPVRAVVIILLVSIFLQPAKMDFRRTFWYGEDNQTDLFGRIDYWLSGSLQSWSEALADPSGERLLGYVRNSMLRVTLLNHAANVHEKTPDIVPFQQGQLYLFSIAGLVPRFLWPDKPSGNDANRFYQVAYEVTPENRLNDVSIAIGFLSEAYISFGWIGVVVVMFLLGAFYDILRAIFFYNPRNEVITGIGILAVVTLFRIETQLSLYLVSTIQAITVGYIVLLPTIIVRSRSESV